MARGWWAASADKGELCWTQSASYGDAGLHTGCIGTFPGPAVSGVRGWWDVQFVQDAGAQRSQTKRAGAKASAYRTRASAPKWRADATSVSGLASVATLRSRCSVTSMKTDGSK